MAIIFTQITPLPDVMDFLDENSVACQEAKDYCRSLGNITMDEFMDIIEGNDEFKPMWISWCVMSFPKLMNQYLLLRFEQELMRYPEQMAIVAKAKKRKGEIMELVNNA
jgi:hypothetical protein